MQRTLPQVAIQVGTRHQSHLREPGFPGRQRSKGGHDLDSGRVVREHRGRREAVRVIHSKLRRRGTRDTTGSADKRGEVVAKDRPGLGLALQDPATFD